MANPLDPTLEKQLDPVFVAIYNNVMVNAPRMYELPVATARAIYETFVAGMLDAVELASVEDVEASLDEEGNVPVKLRVYTPKGPKPPGGWPCYFHMHGGGWCLGSSTSEENHCTIWAQGAQCKVISVDYRLAPEHQFPAGVEDAWTAYRWVSANAAKLDIDAGKIAVGGTSAGASFAAYLCHAVNEHNASESTKLAKPVRQILMVPSVSIASTVVDIKNPVIDPTRLRFINAPGQNYIAGKWFVNMYCPNETLRFDKRCSPLLFDDDSFKNQPPAQFHLAEIDLLTADSTLYSEKLKSAGNHVEVHIHKGCPHIFVGFTKHMAQAQQMVADVTQGLINAFN